MLLGKEPSKFEVYNDIEGELVNFFRVVKNRPAELLLELDLLPLNSREEFTSWLHFHDGSNEPNIHLADQLEIIDRTTPTSLIEEAEKLKTSLRKRSDYRDVRQAAAYLMRVRNSYFVANSNSAIIEQELFDQATELRKARRNPAVQGQARFLARKLRCDCCGSLFRSKQVRGIWYWVCRTHEESIKTCPLLPVSEAEIFGAFLRLHFKLRNHPEVLSFLLKQEQRIRNRRILWCSAAIELNKEISDILDQSHALSLLNRKRMVDPDIFISKNNQLSERLRKAKQQKEKLHNLEHDQVIDQTQQLQETLLTGSDILDAFDEELFCELIDRITVQSNTQVRFRLKNGLELTESIERTVR